MKRIIFVCLFFMLLFLIGCTNQVTNNDYQKDQFVSNISQKFTLLNQNGYFNNIKDGSFKKSINKSENDPSYIDQSKMEILINTPEIALNEMGDEEKGYEKLDLTNTIVNEDSTAEDVYQKMNLIDPEMAEEYKTNLTQNIQKIERTNNIRISTENIIDFKKIKLKILPPPTNTKGPFAKDFNLDTIYWYAGYCATTTAGLVLYRYRPFWSWTKWVGLGIAIAGTAAMTGQLIIWYSSTPEIIEFVNMTTHLYDLFIGVINCSTPDGAYKWLVNYIKNNYPNLCGKVDIVFKKIINYFFAHYTNFYDFLNLYKNYISKDNVFVTKLGTVFLSTAAPALFAMAFCPALVQSIRNAWNNFIKSIIYAIPGTTITITINGIKLGPI